MNDRLRLTAPAWGLLVASLALGPVVRDTRAATGGDTYYHRAIAQVTGHLSHRRADEARTVVEDLRRRYPRDGFVQFLAGKAAFLQSDYARSLELLEEVAQTQGAPGDLKDFCTLVRGAAKTARRFHSRDSDHFSVRCVPGPDDVLADDALDALEKAYVEIGKDLDCYPKGKIVVEVQPDARTFSTASTLTPAEIKTSGTVAICKFNRIMITTPRVFLRGYPWLDTLCHEYVHYLIVKKCGDTIPIWLHEGIAKHEEVRWRSRKPTPLGLTAESLLAEARERNYHITFEQMHPSLAKLKSGSDAALAFAEVKCAVEEIVRAGGSDAIARTLALTASGTDVRDAIAKVVRTPFSDFRNVWRGKIASPNFRRIPGLRHLPPKAKEGDEQDLDPFADQAGKRGHELIHLGDLLHQHGRHAAAAIEYQKASEVAGVISPYVLNRAAQSHLAATNYRDAEAILRKAKKYYPGYVTTYSKLGTLYQRKKDYDKAAEALCWATRINPFDPLVRRSLVEVYEATGRNELAKAQAQKVMILCKTPRDDEND